MTQPHLFSFGHGYSAQALARRLLPRGWAITGTTRSADKAQEFDSAGVTPLVLGQDPILPQLSQATHLLISAAPGPDGDPMLQHYRDELVKAASHLTWVGYLSTTGVYGNHAGDWVTEETALAPATKRGIARVEAEAAWQSFARDLGLNLSIFRLAGIYGPGRGPFAKVRSGKARRIIKPGQIFSRIHVEDIAQVVEAAIHRPKLSGIYNVCDDLPVPPQDVIGYAAELLGLPLPPEEDFETADITPMARSFYAESKKVSNEKMKRDLDVKLIYPDYKTGLKALLAQDQ
ncbi:MAG: SDR family oxidoreductase [Alphaproteobacteria bacterium]|nr:SDR family oxidoreductase [Alphaproteobacteria bacterium]MBU1280985.1 SDR family oxidoreductase [Alphaproteobacteria bacterium]MBU1575525.1 SDR family oxidoreductase [Alphaproteobacteria bacterium]MBU1829460.1 SDR family oxidoreductase [Alphaproteobacteria bacterium]MBU2077034.1 SDR family oxidoreductase [Alphaproteobacteria bacterium]